MKALENCYLMVMFLKTLVEPITISSFREKSVFTFCFEKLFNYPSSTCKRKNFISINTINFYIFWILRNSYKKFSMQYWYR